MPVGRARRRRRVGDRDPVRSGRAGHPRRTAALADCGHGGATTRTEAPIRPGRPPHPSGCRRLLQVRARRCGLARPEPTHSSPSGARARRPVTAGQRTLVTRSNGMPPSEPTPRRRPILQALSENPMPPVHAHRPGPNRHPCSLLSAVMRSLIRVGPCAIQTVTGARSGYRTDMSPPSGTYLSVT